jgi:hypothetical protein
MRTVPSAGFLDALEQVSLTQAGAIIHREDFPG